MQSSLDTGLHHIIHFIRAKQTHSLISESWNRNETHHIDGAQTFKASERVLHSKHSGFLAFLFLIKKCSLICFVCQPVAARYFIFLVCFDLTFKLNTHIYTYKYLSCAAYVHCIHYEYKANQSVRRSLFAYNRWK